MGGCGCLRGVEAAACTRVGVVARSHYRHGRTGVDKAGYASTWSGCTRYGGRLLGGRVVGLRIAAVGVIGNQSRPRGSRLAASGLMVLSSVEMESVSVIIECGMMMVY